MARKRKPKTSGSSRGPQIVTIILIAGMSGFLVSSISNVRKKIDTFHQSLFNTNETTTRVSFSPTKMALIVTTTVTSKVSPLQERLKDFPLLILPTGYKITHYIGMTSHKGTIEPLGGSFNNNLKTEFQMSDDESVTFQSSNFDYKDLGQEINIGALSGKFGLKGDTNLSLNNIEYKNNKFQFSLSGVQINFSKTEHKGLFKASEMTLNGIKLAAPEGHLNQNGKITKLTFKAEFEKKAINIDQTTEILDLNGRPLPVTYGTYDIPVKVIDAIFDPGMNAVFAAQEKALLALKDPKKVLVHNLTKDLNKATFKMTILQSFAHARHISKDADYFKISIPKEDAIEKQTLNLNSNNRAVEKAEEWIKAGGEKTFELAMYNLHFSLDFYITNAVDILLSRLAKTHADDPLYNLLRAHLILKRGYISYQNWTPQSLSEAKAILTKLNSEHKFSDLINFKIHAINKDLPNRDVYLQKFLEKENDSVIKALVQAEKLRKEDPASALKYLEEAHCIDAKHYAMSGYLRDKVHIYGAMKDTASQEAIYKELVSLPDPHLYDLINYSGILIDQKRYREAKPIIEKCYEMTKPGSFCYSRHEVVTVRLAYEKNAANDKEGAIKDIEQLLITQPNSMEAYYGLGWITHNTDIDKSINYYSISCALGAGNGCLYAADRLHYEKKDTPSSIPFYEMACDKKVINACTKLGFRLEEKGESELAQSFYKKSCLDQKDSIGCYHLGRIMHQLNKPKEEVANYLDITCKNFKEVCPFSATIRSGKPLELPRHPPGPKTDL